MKRYKDSSLLFSRYDEKISGALQKTILQLVKTIAGLADIYKRGIKKKKHPPTMGALSGSTAA
ncbi:hypothetical protein [Cesiribacter andamanensis]|uniref:hypothetical protein n=1 Tax=Cesiribacter andamanensis TaxID=649507 RepID=UPI0013788EA8|nr:hypothetical protein [Cesiribacter andamanensis]